MLLALLLLLHLLLVVQEVALLHLRCHHLARKLTLLLVLRARIELHRGLLLLERSLVL